MAENKPEIMIIEHPSALQKALKPPKGVEHPKVESYLIEVIEDKPEDKPENKTENKAKKTRKLRVPSRTVILEDGTVKYDNKPRDPKYFVNYYHSTRKFKEAVVVNCKLCDRPTTVGHLRRHMKTNICKKYYEIRLSKEKPDYDDVKPFDDDDDAKSSNHDYDDNDDDDDDDDDK